MAVHFATKKPGKLGLAGQHGAIFKIKMLPIMDVVTRQNVRVEQHAGQVKFGSFPPHT